MRSVIISKSLTEENIKPFERKSCVFSVCFYTFLSLEYYASSVLSRCCFGSLFVSLYRIRLRETTNNDFSIDPFPKSHKLVHIGGFLTFVALYCSLNMVGSTEIS